MNRFARFLTLLSLLLALFFAVSAVSAQDGSPPTPPTPVPLDDPTNLRAVLIWLASGGGGVAVALWLEKQAWFNKLNPSSKPAVVMAFIASVALVPQLLLNFIPNNVWEVIGPYFATIMAALLVGYPLSQYAHVHLNGYLKKYVAEEPTPEPVNDGTGPF